jgi:hypothetical protein
MVHRKIWLVRLHNSPDAFAILLLLRIGLV